MSTSWRTVCCSPDEQIVVRAGRKPAGKDPGALPSEDGFSDALPWLEIGAGVVAVYVGVELLKTFWPVLLAGGAIYLIYHQASNR